MRACTLALLCRQYNCFPGVSCLRSQCAAAQTVVMLTYVLTLNWERESRRARDKFTLPAGAPAASSDAVDSRGAANGTGGDLEQGAPLLNGGGERSAQPSAATALPDQPLGVAAGAGALAPGHEAPVRQLLQ